MRPPLAALLLLLAPLPLLAQAQTILGVFAHPDDEVYWGTGALLAKSVKEGHQVYVVTVTSGQLGVTTHAQIPAGPELGAVREEELRCSARALGIQTPFAFGFHDQGLATALVMDEFARRLRAVIDEVKPAVIITHPPDGLSGHIDRRITSAVVTEVFAERTRLKHQPSRLYYLAYPESRIPLVAGATDGRRQYRSTADALITTAIDARDGDAEADASIECHKSQVTAANIAALKALRRDTLQSIVYLRLAMTDAAWPASKETSLFAPASVLNGERNTRFR
jgi:LmbE family N-acetylglucosaminyl deacetylase